MFWSTSAPGVSFQYEYNVPLEFKFICAPIEGACDDRYLLVRSSNYIFLRSINFDLAKRSCTDERRSRTAGANEVRDFVSGPDGNKRLASLQMAVAKMKSLDNAPPTSADFRRSWTYWANIHGYLGPQSKFQTLAYQKDRLVSYRCRSFCRTWWGRPTSRASRIDSAGCHCESGLGYLPALTAGSTT